MPTRLPYGVSFIKPGDASTAYTFTAGDVTPDVSMGTVFFTATSGITLTNFDGGERGKIIFVISDSASVTTLQSSAGGIALNAMVTTVSTNFLKYSSTGNYVMGNNDVIQLVYTGTEWIQVSPSIRV